MTRENKDTRDESVTTRHVLTTLSYACFYSVYELFYNTAGKRGLTAHNLSHLDLAGVAVMLMAVGVHLAIQVSLDVKWNI